MIAWNVTIFIRPLYIYIHRNHHNGEEKEKSENDFYILTQRVMKHVGMHEASTDMKPVNMYSELNNVRSHNTRNCALMD